MIKRRKIIYRILLVVILGLGIWVYTRWNAWFYNPEEEPYKMKNVPARVLLTFGNSGENSRIVSWVCGETIDEKARLYLAYGTDTIVKPAVGEVFESRAGKTAFYRCELKDLGASTDYSYMVETNGARSSWYHFRTSDVNSSSFSFMYVGDVQDTINGDANRLLKQAIQLHPEVEFVAFGGDLIERPMNSYYVETFRSIDSICTAMPVVTVTGNHDYLKYPIRKCEKRFALTFPYFLKGQEERGDRNHLFTFRYHNTDFYLLDSEREFFYLYGQKSWLKEKMTTSDAAHRIVILHHPLYSVKRKNNNLMQRWMFDDIIRESNTDLVLQGHEHAYTHCTADEAPLKGAQCTVPPLYVISHCSPKNYSIHTTERFHPVVQGSRYYQIVDVNAESVILRSYDVVDNAIVDSVCVMKSVSGR